MIQLGDIRDAVRAGKTIWQYHSSQMLIERRIASADVIASIIDGVVIEEYHNDKPFPSMLILGWIGNRPIHTVCSFNDSIGMVHIITVYEPDLDHFEADFRTRRSKIHE